jgi:hypothetical protein
VLYKSLYIEALTNHTTTKMAFLMTSTVHSYLNSTLRRSLTTMKGERLSKVEAFCFDRNHFVLGPLNHFVGRLIQAGIAKHLTDYGQWFLFRQFDEEIADPRRILALSDLEFGFVLWLVACCVSLLTFIGEVLCNQVGLRVMRWLRVVAGLVEFLGVLRARMGEYHDGW